MLRSQRHPLLVNLASAEYFDAEGYYYSARDSREDHWVFLRDRPSPSRR